MIMAMTEAHIPVDSGELQEGDAAQVRRIYLECDLPYRRQPFTPAFPALSLLQLAFIAPESACFHSTRERMVRIHRSRRYKVVNETCYSGLRQSEIEGASPNTVVWLPVYGPAGWQPLADVTERGDYCYWPTAGAIASQQCSGAAPICDDCRD